MDPLTQGIVGAALPQATVKKKPFVLAALFGLVGGMTADLDVLIRSDIDPLIYLEYHRQFTHALIFIPVGGFICALLLYGIMRFGPGLWRRSSSAAGRSTRSEPPLSFGKTFAFCTLGYATHGLLDSATSYGTMLFWPFSDARIAWNYISIIDPLFTLPILILVILSAWRKAPLYVRLGLVWGVLYMGFGAFQNYRAEQVGALLARERGHEAQQLSAKPSFGNLLVWKVIYRHDDTYFVDAVRVAPLGGVKIYPGSSIAALSMSRDFPWLDGNSQQARDVERFRWFSMGYLSQSPEYPNRIIDMRYSFLPHQINGLWSIELTPDTDPAQHVDFVTHRQAGSIERETLLKMIMGKDL